MSPARADRPPRTWRAEAAPRSRHGRVEARRPELPGDRPGRAASSSLAALLVGASLALAGPVGAAAASLEGQVNVNTASIRRLSMLPGVGPKTARRIVAARPYGTVDELLRVKGIGKVTLARLRPYLRLHGPSTLYRRRPTSSCCRGSRCSARPRIIHLTPKRAARTPTGRPVEILRHGR